MAGRGGAVGCTVLNKYFLRQTNDYLLYSMRNGNYMEQHAWKMDSRLVDGISF